MTLATTYISSLNATDHDKIKRPQTINKFIVIFFYWSQKVIQHSYNKSETTFKYVDNDRERNYNELIDMYHSLKFK